MKSQKVIDLFLIILFFMFIYGCKSTPKDKTDITVNGMIYDTDNRPVVNYLIFIDGQAYGISDIGGRFTLKKVSKGKHLLSGNGTGYLSISQEINILDKSQILYLRVPSVESRFKEAYFFITQEEYSKAEECIKDILLSESENSDALFFMSLIKHLQGDKEQSLEYINRFREKEENSKYAEELEKLILEN